MDVNQVFHMNGGAGEDSYAKNSTVQNDILHMTKPYTEQALVECVDGGTTTEKGKLGIADLGCSSGPTALAAITHMLDVMHDMWRKRGGKSPVVVVYLNDLPGNDFNYLFESLPSFFEKVKSEKGDEFGPCFIFGAPGSFYGRLFPTQSLHFVHSSSSLHWLSKLPLGLDEKTRPLLNKGKVNISKTSSKEIVQAYIKQFERDFTSFLESRSKEVIEDGRMVLSFMGRLSINPIEEEDSYLQWELIAHSLMTLVYEGKVEEEMVDSFNIPYYTPCPEEIKHLVQTQGSFKIDQLRTFEINWDGCRGIESNQSEPEKHFVNGRKMISRGERIARIHRAVLEPIFKYHFGESIMDELFHRYGIILDSYLTTREPKFINLIITLVRKPHGVFLFNQPPHGV